MDEKASSPSPPPPIREQDRAEADRELQLRKAGAISGASYLTAETVAWAKARPDDPSVPEGLGRGLQTIDYSTSCSANPDSRRISGDAFHLLKQRYPDTNWAQKTKYWYW